VLTDVERLCNVHIPRWLATAGMGADKIAAFYDDGVKIASDKYSADKAHYLRSLSTEAALAWRARRWGKFVAHLGKGALRGAGERFSVKSLDRERAPARSSAG
jgi:hypothetical protein